MSRQTTSKKTVILFLLLVISSGLPVYSFGFPFQNLLDSVGVLPEAEAQLPEAEAQVFEEYTVRNATSQTTYYSETRGSTLMGLPEHIEDNQGDFVPNILNEDVNGFQLESGTVSYYYDKNACGMTQFEKGRIITGETAPIIKSNSWAVKVAVNGTDNWSDVVENDLPCTVTVVTNEDGVILNSTKSDSNGTITELWEYELYKGLKQTVQFTNNNTSYNNHKFSFSNIMEDTPKSFGLQIMNASGVSTQFDLYSVFNSDFQPFQVGGLAQVLNTTSGQTVEYSFDQLFNGTQQITNGFTWYDKDQGLIGYDFDIGIDKLWALKFIANDDNTLDVYVDYANVNQPLAVGSMMEIDPTVQPPESDYFQVFSSTSTSSNSACSVGWASATLGTGFFASITGSAETCWTPVWKFDISAIPDTATPVSMTFSLNATANSNTSTTGFQLGGNIRPILEEDIFSAQPKDIGDVIYNNGAGGAGNIMLTNDFFLGSWFTTTNSYVGVHASTATTPSTPTTRLETQLESGKDFIQYVGCRNSTNTCAHTTNFFGGASMTFDPNTTFLEVQWEQFTVPAATQNVSAVFSASPDKCSIDWDPPLDNGGRPITGYQIQRSTGGAFQVIVADTGGSLPTNFDDTTIVAGVSNTYIVNTITLEGIGADSVVSNGCGVPVTPDQPLLQTPINVGVGIVALDWVAPTFDGNTPITGYQIDRTTGTPTQVSNIWNWGILRDAGLDAVSVTQDLDNIIWTNNPLSDTVNQASFVLFQTFSRTELDGRTMTVVSKDVNMSPVTAAYIIEIRDGAYSPVGMNQGSGDFPSGSSIVSKGTGVIQSIVSRTGNQGGTVFTDIAVIDTSTAILDDVTVFVRALDTNTQFSRPSNVKIDNIDIEGIGSWDFGNQLPTKSVLINDIITDDLGLTPLGLGLTGRIDTQSGFIIGDGFTTLVADTGNTNVEFLDNTVVESTTYGYRVFALNSEGTSPSSNIVQILTAGAPSSPEPITVTAVGTQSISIDWNDADLNGGTLVEYEIERKQGVGGIFSTLTTVTTTDHTDGTGLFTLVPATEYCYHIKTITNIGSSAFTTEQCATTFDAPAVVENLTVTALDGSSVNMQFDTPLSDGGSPITGFKVERQIGGGGFVTLDALTSIQTRNDTGLPIGTLIEYRVSASNQFGFGNTVIAGDTTDATPQVPQNFVCSAGSPTSINLSWDTPLTFSPPTGYQIARNVDGSAFTILVADTSSTGTTFNDPSLSTTSIYGYRILAHTAEGDTLFTDDVFCKTLGIPDSPPENFIATFPLVIPHDITLTWDIPNTFGIPIISFIVERDDGTGFNEIATLPPNAVGMVDNSPDNDVQQKYRIKITGSVGDTPYSVGVSSVANQTSHWNYEKSFDDVGLNKNTGTVIGTANFNNTLHNGLAHTFDGSTRIEVDQLQESDYDFDNDSLGITTYYKGNSTGLAQMLVSKASSITSTGYKFFIDSTGVPAVRLTATSGTDEIHVLGSTNVTDNSSHFLGFGYNGNQTASGVSLMVDGVFETKNVITDNLIGSILNNDPLVLGADSSGTNTLNGILDETRLFGSGTLDDTQMLNVFNEEIQTIAPINATMSLSGSTFADISSESSTITLVSGFPLPTITGNIELKNFTTTTVNTLPSQTIPASGTLDLIAMFNTMGSTSNYTTLATLDNGLEVFFVVSNADVQNPEFSLPAGIDFFFQEQRNNDFSLLSFNFTRTVIPFDLSCNIKSELFANGTTFTFTDVGFLQELFPVPPTKDVVVACIDPNSPLLDPSEPSFGGSNALLTFVSFGDTSGIGAFLNFTDNYGDFFGAPLPFLFVILAAALFTGRSAPTGIIIVGIAIGAMWALGILTIDPILWGIIVVLVILGAIGGKKFL